MKNNHSYKKNSSNFRKNSPFESILERTPPSNLFYKTKNLLIRPVCRNLGYDKLSCKTWRSCKIFSNCVNFSWKPWVSLQNLRINMKSTHLFGKFRHPFLQSYWNFTFSFKLIICIKIYAVLLLAKLVPIYAFLVCKFFGSKFRLCKFFYKFQIC